MAKLSNWFNNRTLRERAAVAGAAAAVVLLVIYVGAIDPLLKQQRNLTRQMIDVQRNVTALAAQESLILARAQADPDRANRERVVALQAEIEKLQARLEENISNLVSPQQMVQLLKELLAQQKSLRLVSLSNRKPELLDLGNSDQNKERPKLYKHLLEMELSGDYRALIDYLETLKKLPRSMVWETVDIETEEYPISTIKMQVYTLSLAEGWIGG